MIVSFVTCEDRMKRIGTWTKWYAWHPVWWDGGFAWLDYIERRYVAAYDSYGWDYRIIGDASELQPLE